MLQLLFYYFFLFLSSALVSHPHRTPFLVHACCRERRQHEMPLHGGGSQTQPLIPRDTTKSRQHTRTHTHERNFEFFVRVVDFFARQPWRNLSTTAQRGQSTLSCGELHGVMAEGLAASHGSHHVSVNASLEVQGMPSPSCSRLQQSPCVCRLTHTTE